MSIMMLILVMNGILGRQSVAGHTLSVHQVLSYE